MIAAFVYPINTVMNIQELDAYNLDDAVKFNDRLNPRLWDKSEHLKPEVRDRLLLIAEDFKEFLGIKDLDLQDITISGSNAAYTYTPNSDIDLHLVVNMPEDEVYRELFDAKKFQYNEQHNIKIGGYDVELYVQDADQPHISQGIYSIANNDWVQVPRRAKADVDDASTRNKFETVGHQIEQAIASGSLKNMTRMSEKIKRMRQTGLEQHGEFGPENLAFKMLRSQGVLQKLHNAKAEARSQELSLKERRKPHSVFTYGFKHEESVQEGSAGLRPVGLTPDGVSPDTRMIVSDVNDSFEDEEILKDFIDFCSKELKLNELPVIKLRKDPQWSVVHKTFGRYINDKKMLEVAWGQRHIMDILRTVAHELTHRHQHEREEVPATAGETGSEYENEANARAGVLMRDYARLHPEFFAVGQAEELHIDEGIKSSTAAAAIVAALAGNPIPVSAQVGNFISIIQDAGTAARTAQKITRAGINAEVQQEIQNYVRAVGGDPGGQNLSHLYQLQRELKRQAEPTQSGPLPGYMQQATSPANESASGYIPTKKQAKDPRFSMALTQDIKPGQLGKEANKLKLKTDSQGHPQVANTNGLFEELKLQLEAFKRAEEDYSPDAPPGPESKPTMPKGTVRVDVSDVYDWYKLGQHISNMKGLGQHDFGKGPPSSIISFGDEDTEHKFIDDLKATGLDVTDIDPKDPVKRPGKTIKTDPTYNVNESEDLDEVKMSPTALKKFADSPAAKGIMVGFEAEMIVPDVGTEDMEPEWEADYDQDERAYSVQQVIDFFNSGEFGGIGRQEQAELEDGLNDLYLEWSDEQMMRDFKDEAEDLIRKVIEQEDFDWDDEVRKQLFLQGIDGNDQDAVMQAGKEAPAFNTSAEQQAYMAEHPEYEKYIESYEEAEDLLNELVQDSVRAQDKYWDAAIDDYRDNYYVNDDSSFFEDVGLQNMTDIANRFNVPWPFLYDANEGQGGEMSIDEVADDLSQALGMPVVASYSYHGTKRKPGEFIIEPDSSLSPDNSEDGGLEIISPPMPIEQAMQKLNQVIEWAQARGCYTNSSTGLHMGVSLPGQQSFAEAEGDDAESAPVSEKPIDFMKLALFLGDQYVLKEFGRSANNYCRSSLQKMKEKKWSPQQIATAMEKMRGNLINMAYKDLADRSPGRDSINMKDNYVEFRGAGGDYLSKESDQGMAFLENTLLRYVQALAIAGDPTAYRQEYAKKLYKLISPEGDNTLDLFSKFATGEIDKEKLKTEWARKTLEKDDPSAVTKGEWVVVDKNTKKPVQGQSYNGYTQDEVFDRARDKLTPGMSRSTFDQKYSIEPQNTGRWEIYSFDADDDRPETEQTLEIVDADNRGAAADAVYDKYNAQKIPFKVRPYYGDKATKPEPTRRAKLAKQIIQKPAARDSEQARTPEGVPVWEIYQVDNGHAVHTMADQTEREAKAQAQIWLQHIGAEDSSLFAVRPKLARPATAIRDVEPSVAQNFVEPQDATDVPRNWEFVNRINGQVIHNMTNASYNQANVVQDNLELRYPDADIFLRSVERSN